MVFKDRTFIASAMHDQMVFTVNDCLGISSYKSGNFAKNILDYPSQIKLPKRT